MRSWSVAALLLVAGCWASGRGTLEISEPHVDARDLKGQVKEGVVYLGNISIAVVPINYRRTEEAVGPLFAPVIPVSSNTSYEGQGKPFRIVIELDAASSEIVF